MERHAEVEIVSNYNLLIFPVARFLSLLPCCRDLTVRIALVICHFTSKLWLLKIEMVVKETYSVFLASSRFGIPQILT